MHGPVNGQCQRCSWSRVVLLNAATALRWVASRVGGVPFFSCHPQRALDLDRSLIPLWPPPTRRTFPLTRSRSSPPRFSLLARSQRATTRMHIYSHGWLPFMELLPHLHPGLVQRSKACTCSRDASEAPGHRFLWFLVVVVYRW